ncbi:MULTISPECIES: succinate dehydrogenase cytochrome b subunit [unclassified Aeromicrobium]|uniref:succinate dehydrogenase cytochrome b subunit n=1 Tax=unclassified Aeromicrobium TaxID=2633570 RepID=UPI002889ABA3|nr:MULTISPECIES: succinate dehydrogenase cytochrome b subunit [unclassified Aeromicrobium]
MATTLTRASARRSTVVLKYTMAVSGLIMLGYLLVHMYGNLKFFQGQEYFDSYLEGLENILYPYLPHGGALWILRVVLLVSLVAHVYCAITLWRRNKVAAGYTGTTRYHSKQNRTGIQRSYATFTMRWGGIILLLFIIGHVAQMLPNWLAPGGGSDSKYERVVNGFELWWVVLLYTIGLVAVGFHLWHGFWSALTTLGQNRSSTRKGSAITIASWVLSVVIAGGFLVVPFAIFFFGAGS